MSSMFRTFPSTFITALCVAAMLQASPLQAEAQAPECRPIQAELIRPRRGITATLDKLTQGGEVRIAYLGGSITAQNGWRVKMTSWFGDTFKKAKVREINAAIGGTGSALGVFRLDHDVLRHKPDLLFVEFAVNDGGASPQDIWRGMEGIVRKTWRADPTTDVVFVYTFRVGFEKDLDKDLCPRSMSAMEMLADHYGIPTINMALRVAELAQDGKLQFDTRGGKRPPADEDVILFSNDGVHPIDAGHEIYKRVITGAINRMRQADLPAGPHRIGPPFIADNWERATWVPLKPSMLSDGWRRMDRSKGLAKRFGNRMPELWEATRPGEAIAFTFKGTLAKLYDLLGPDGGQVMITVDGKTRGPVPRFDHYCTYHRIATMGIARGLDDEVHTVTIAIHPDQPDRSAVLKRAKSKKGFDPAKYDGTCLRVAGIMLIGELIE